MKTLLSISFLVFLISLQGIFSDREEYISESYKEKYKSINDNTPDLSLCLNSLDIKSIYFPNVTRCILNFTKYDFNNTKKLLDELIKGLYILLNIDDIGDEWKIIIKIIINMKNNGLFDKAFDIIGKNISIADYIIGIIDEYEKGENMDYIKIWEYIANISQIDGVYDLFVEFYELYREDFFNFTEIILEKYPAYSDIYNIFSQRIKSKPIEKDLILFIFKVLKNYYNSSALINCTIDFLKTHQDYFDLFEEILENEVMNFIKTKILYTNDRIKEAIKNVIFEREGMLKYFYDICKDNQTLETVRDLILNIENDTLIKEIMPGFLSRIVELNNTYLDIITNFFLYFTISFSSNIELSTTIWTHLQKKVGEMFKEEKYTSYNISKKCIDLFNYTFFNYNFQDKTYFLNYFEKFLLSSSRIKGGFATFDNCLREVNESLITDEYIIYPAFIIGLINDPQLTQISKNSSFYLKCNYIRSFCLPFGFKNKEEKENKKPMCSTDDYNKAVRFIINAFSNIDNLNIDSFYLYENNISPNALENLYGLFGIVFLLIPLIIAIILPISKNIIMKRRKRKDNLNELIGDDKIKKENNINDSIKNHKNIKRNEHSKWYIYLNEFFNIFNNGKELFNSLNITNYNNVNGLTYIKGMIGISIILTIFGQTYIALVNLPMREYGIWDFHEIISHFLYIIIFIGYRYSPRLLFSCSGYTLVYKYLCYIEQEQGYYFLKFVFLQSYKYILLFIVLIIFRYSMYYINIMLRQEKRPVWEVFKYFIDKEDNFFRRLFTFLFQIRENGKEMKQNLILYFYIPINEIFFFLFGTILISLGYKYKLRIDLIILILFFLIYAGKIIIYLFYWYPKLNYLTTIDYYLFDYGLKQINSVYNLTCFLIGMYFGLINYSIQKGIYDLYKKDIGYNKIISLKISEPDKQKSDEKNEFKDGLTSYLSNLIINDQTNENEAENDDNEEENKKINSKKDIRKEDVNDINEKNNENLEKYINEETNKNKKKEYSKKIKEMPFLISPVQISNFHRKYKNKWFFSLFIIISFLLIIFFLLAQKILIDTNIKIKENSEKDENLSNLSLDSILTNWTLNIIYLIDIEITIFVVQWATFMLYFKEFEMIRSFLNHVYWSFFLKGYFTFTLVSIPVILFIFYATETVIKLKLFNILLYGFINLIIIFVLIIICYSCYELPLKKMFKFLLKGKGIIDEYEEEDEDESLKGDNE